MGFQQIPGDEPFVDTNYNFCGLCGNQGKEGNILGETSVEGNLMGTLCIFLEPKWCIPLVWMEEEYASHRKEWPKQALSATAPGGGSLYDPHLNRVKQTFISGGTNNS